MKTHELKCWSSAYDAIARGDKTFEYRKNERDFEVGDTLVLVKWDPNGGGLGTGGYPNEAIWPKRIEMRVVVSYILHGGQFDVPAGYCVMSIKKEPAP